MRHKGRYYRIYNHWDSYASGLGSDLVKEILSQGGNLEDLLINWRRLLDLGTVKTSHFKKPDETVDGGAALEEWNRIISSVIQKSGDGKVARWFQDDNRKLTNEQEGNEKLSFGDGLFIEYIYLIDLDDNEFSACHATGDREVLIYPFQALLDEVKTPKNWASMFNSGRAYRSANSFPLPKSLLEPLYKSIQESGYRALETVSESYTMAIYHAIDPSGITPRKVCIKVFFATVHGEVKSERKWEHAKALAELLMKNPHPNIVRTLDVREFGRHPALIFESHGSDLRQLDLSSAEDRRDYISAIAQVANAIAHLHRLGIVQSVVTPADVLFKISKTGKIQAALCDSDTACVPHIQKKPEWKNVGGRAISPSWKEDVDSELVDLITKRYDEHIKKIGEEDTGDLFAEFLMNSCELVFDRKIRSNCVEYELKSDRFNGILTGGSKSIQVPLVFKEALFRDHDWEPFSCAKDAIICKSLWSMPRWESNWGPIMFSKKYSHPEVDTKESEGGCNQWVVDSYSLKVMLEDVKEAEQKSVASGGKKRKSNGDIVSNETSNVLVAIDKMIDALNIPMRLKTEPKGDIYDREESVLESAVSNLEKLQIFLPAE